MRPRILFPLSRAGLLKQLPAIFSRSHDPNPRTWIGNDAGNSARNASHFRSKAFVTRRVLAAAWLGFALALAWADGPAGHAAAVPELEAALSRLATLEPGSDPDTDQVLLEALPRLTGPRQLEVISVLGARRAPDAVMPLTELARRGEGPQATAALRALGRIATPEAAQALTTLRTEVAGSLRAAADTASLEAGERLLQAGNREAALALFEPLYREHPAGPVRHAAFQGLLRAEPERANTRFIHALASSDGALRDLAAEMIAALPADWDTRPLVRNLPHLPARAKVALMQVLAARRDPHLRGVLNGLMRSTDDDVASAAVRAVGAVGSARDVNLLAGAAIVTNAVVRAAARASLRELPGNAVEAEMVSLLPRAKPAARAELMLALADRGASNAAPAFLPYATDTNQVVGVAALEASARFGRLEDALARAESLEEKQRVLAALAEVPDITALRWVAGQLTHPALANEAGTAAVKISARLPEAHRTEAVAVLEQVVKTATDRSVVGDAQRQLEALKRPR
jgi:HEAT repeat protein